MSSKEKVTIVTHSSSFHTDDVFAVATLLLVLEKDHEVEVIRSRDRSIIEKADYVVDVGDIYDPSKNRFDHHQAGGAGERANGVPYAGFGLVWKEFGESLCGSKEIAEEIDKKIVQPIDGPDNGFGFMKSNIPDIFSFDVGSMTHLFSPTWDEKDADLYKIFIKLVSYAKVILERMIKVGKDDLEARNILISTYNNTKDKRLIFSDEGFPWEAVLAKFPEPLFVIYENKDKNWTIKGIRNDASTFELRKKLPESWAGKRDEELEKITGIPGSIFCHRQRFMAVNKTKEGILKMAEIALNSL